MINLHPSCGYSAILDMDTNVGFSSSLQNMATPPRYPNHTDLCLAPRRPAIKKRLNRDSVQVRTPPRKFRDFDKITWAPKKASRYCTCRTPEKKLQKDSESLLLAPRARRTPKSIRSDIERRFEKITWAPRKNFFLLKISAKKMAEVQNGGSPPLPFVPNPAPHRGFNAKAREVLIEPSTKFTAVLARHPSDQELITNKTKTLKRTDSELTNTSTKSQSSSHSYPLITEEFDSIEDLPRASKPKKTLGDIGKTRSAGDLFKNSKKPQALIKTFQQMNIMKLPSVESDVGETHTRSLTKLNDFVFDDFSSNREGRYRMK
ncbi:hypothetical protein FO519_008315 [Halicephalobus sp. NKZ332]|nr:hypothetical protein FO519_008315 [Halicephalobus sp. NKZ332]